MSRRKRIRVLVFLALVLGSLSVSASRGQSAAGNGAAAGHHPDLPGIECPLRSKGIDPTQLRPFAEVADYIAFLERPDRAAWQKPDTVIAAMDLTGRETVVDLGAGSGYFSFRLAQLLPQGLVVAAERDQLRAPHRHINERILKDYRLPQRISG
jgi:hypothetical protein